MSIALENNRIGQVSGSGLMHRKKIQSCNVSILDLKNGDHGLVRVDERGNGLVETCTSSSSIGKNSDDDDENDEEEVESKFNNNNNNNNNPLHSAVDALEQALPIRRGISKFYTGKSKSFASLSDAACTSIKEISKPENAYTRKRKNLLAYSLLCDKGRSSLHKSHGIGGGIMKRAIHPSRSTLPLAIAMSSSDSSIDENWFGSSPETSRANGSWTPSESPPESPLPPMPWRSFSVADLQHCAVSVGCSVNSNLSSSVSVIRKNTKSDEVA